MRRKRWECEFVGAGRQDKAIYTLQRATQLQPSVGTERHQLQREFKLLAQGRNYRRCPVDDNAL